MTEEQIEIKSREYAEGRGHEHYNFLFEENAGSPVDFARLCYADGLKDGATESTKELQEEIIKLKKNNNTLFNTTEKVGKKNNELQKQIEIDAEQIRALQKQNGELTDKVKELETLKLKLEALEGQTPWKDIKDKSEVIGNLTKAKEIIKKLKVLYLSPVVTKDDVMRQDEILNEAEQFIKE